MSKFLSIVALCAVLIMGSIFGPTLRDAVTARLLKSPEAVLAIDQRVANNPAYMQAFLNWVGDYVMNMASGFVASQVAAVDKAIAARMELLQAKLNMKAATQINDRFAAANDRFNIAPERTCRLLNETMETAQALVLTEVNRKALSRRETVRLSAADHSNATAAAVMKQHDENYCSTTDVDRGRCKFVSLLPNADVTASTLFIAEGPETLSDDQFRAAKAFVNMVHRPVPIEDIPKGLEETSEGQRFLLEKKKAIAIDSLVADSFSRILSSRSPRN